MTKRLSPERIADLKQETTWYSRERDCSFWEEAEELLGHIEALEDELREEQKQASETTCELQTCIRVQMKELAEAKAEIARLKELLTSYDMHWETLGTEVGP